MSNPERRGRELLLTELPPRTPARIVRIESRALPWVAGHGLHPGTLVSVEHDAPFAGPRVVRVRGRRLVLPRAAADGMVVQPEVSPTAFHSEAAR